MAVPPLPCAPTLLTGLFCNGLIEKREELVLFIYLETSPNAQLEITVHPHALPIYQPLLRGGYRQAKGVL